MKGGAKKSLPMVVGGHKEACRRRHSHPPVVGSSEYYTGVTCPQYLDLMTTVTAHIAH